MIPVDEHVYNRYKRFCEALSKQVKPGKTVGMVAEKMRGEWGDSYWYYFFFGREYYDVVERNDKEVAS